ncbi:MAG: isomerase [Bacteroidota bacterium]|nr:isomerase [Bacteroidota bacterium]
MKIYKLDAFTDQVFKGNPAAVVPLEKWLPVETMQQIAAENNLAETAFFVKEGDKYHIKWFTPTVEIELCGHATLASAFVLFNYMNYDREEIHFTCQVGDLMVKKEGEYITLNFPADAGITVDDVSMLEENLGLKPLNVRKGRTKYLVEVESEEVVQNFQPDFQKIKNIDKQVIITAKGNKVDFVSRFFAPNSGVNEDPATGSAHCVLIPYWAEKLQKQELIAHQLSWRTAFFKCKNLNDRVEMSGKAVCYLTGEIYF